jgi:hypothetical protein
MLNLAMRDVHIARIFYLLVLSALTANSSCVNSWQAPMCVLWTAVAMRR